MKKSYQLSSLVLLLLAMFNAANAQTIFVSTTGSDDNDGASWANSFQTLQKALSTASSGSQIWVAQGTYYPDQGGGRTMGDRNASFSMVNGVAIYGGFAGTEHTLGDRDWRTNVTTLSGDIGTPGDKNDNSYHVVFNNNNGLNNTAVLDGFVITGGNANGSDPNDGGGGMHNITTNPAVSNVSFISNAASYGGAIYNSYCNPTLTNVLFQSNTAYSGGGMYNSSGAPTIINAAFINNSATYQGGGIVDVASPATLINVSFQGNSGAQGGGMFTFSNPPSLVNCVFWNNGGGNTFYDYLGTSPRASYCLFDATVTGGATRGTGNLTTSTSPFVTANSVALNACSPAIDAGLNSAVPSSITTDFAGNSRISNATAKPTPIVDMGAYEFVGSAFITYYLDFDNDGYSDGTTTSQCAKPANYKLQSELKSTAIDCDDSDPNINPGTVWVLDNDNDGYYSGDPVSQCASPGTGYIIKTTQLAGDCSDNDGTIHAAQTYYLDFDKDGYGNPAKTISVCSLTPPAGYVANNRDCNDNDPAISPVAVEVCGNKVDDNCDGAVDEKTCYACQNAINLTTSNITSYTVQLNWNATANPQQWELEYKSIAKGSKWISVILTGNIRSVKITGLTAKQSYLWHVRAKCNGKWTDYTGTGSFTTAVTPIAGRSDQQSNSVMQHDEESTAIKLYPNPTREQFTIELHLANNINSNAKIELLNMMGQTVLTGNTFINNSTLLKNMSMPSSIAPGIYIARITVDNKTYQLRLVYEK